MPEAELTRATWYLVIGTWALALGTVVFLALQLREAKRTTALNLHLRLLELWEGPGIASVRSRVAATLLRNREPAPNETETILDHLDGLAFHANRGHVDFDIVWNDFGAAVLCYWHALSKYVLTQRPIRMDQTLYSEVEALNRKVKAEDIQRRQLAPGSNIPGDDELKAFLIAEASVEDLLATAKVTIP